MKKYSKYIAFLLFLSTILVLFLLLAPKEINWSYSFSKDDKIPYGNFVTYKAADEIFDEGIHPVTQPIYNNIDTELDSGMNYIFINDNFSPDEYDIQALYEFIVKGNDVFIAAGYFNSAFRDTFNVSTSLRFINQDSLMVNFSNQKLKNDHNYVYKKVPFDYYFSGFSDSNTVVLGVNNSNRANFIKQKIGKGNLYINLVPLAFTNYNILDTVNANYIFKALSYLPAENYTYWDEYYKTGKAMIRTPLIYILSTESLTWAYYVSIFIILVYIIFEGKRKQRIIPIIKPFSNTTLQFVETIGKLYYQKKDHKNIAMKKINYFLDHIRNNYYIKGNIFNDEELNLISEKSMVNLTAIRNIFSSINNIEMKNKISEDELKNLNSLIESFYNSAGIYGRTI